MASDFDRCYNISYIEEDGQPSNKLIAKHCLCSFIIYFIIYFLLILNPFFKGYFIKILQHCYIIFYILYVIFAPILYYVFRPKTLYKSHNIEICNYFIRIFKQIFSKNTILKSDYLSILKSFIPSYNEKQALMLMFIKVFFGTMMAYSLHSNVNTLGKHITKFSAYAVDFSSVIMLKEWIIRHSKFLYNFILNIIYIVDLIPFVIGYLTELSILNNKVRTVDTNILGVIICLMCYPPFNSASTSFLGWYQNSDPVLPHNLMWLNWIFLIVGLFFIFIYAIASVALGFKASNLTNRGIVCRFPYNIVRHPAYICKCLFWFFTTIQVLFVNFNSNYFNLSNYLVHSSLVISSYVFWVFIYYLRAITEERHLMQDPDYQEYCKKVRWRFIPYVI